MSDKDKQKKTFLKINIQKVITTIIVMVFTGVLGLIGSVTIGALEDIKELKEWKAEVDTRISENIIKDLEELKEDFEDYTKEISVKMGVMDGKNTKLQNMIYKLEGIIEVLRGIR